MAYQFRMTPILMALVLLGCKGIQPTSAASSGTLAAPSSVASIDAAGSSDGATRIEYITDPTMNNMRVMPIQVPASWKFRGVLVPQGPCTNSVSEVFRATSPDGRSFMEVMPRMGWRWGNLWAAAHRSDEGCLPIHERISPQDFLKQFSTTIPVQYVGAASDPQIENVVKIPGGTWQGGLADVRFKNGSVAMKGRMMAGLFCSQTPAPSNQAAPGWGQRNAPQQYAAPGLSGDNAMRWSRSLPRRRASSLPSRSFGPLPEWAGTKSWTTGSPCIASVRRSPAGLDHAIPERVECILRGAAEQMYKDAAAVQQEAHNQFLQTMQEGTDRSMARAADVANSNHRMAQDMVDSLSIAKPSSIAETEKRRSAGLPTCSTATCSTVRPCPWTRTSPSPRSS